MDSWPEGYDYLSIISQATVSLLPFRIRSYSKHTADHFHVHIVTLELTGSANANVGMAHLLDDVIALVSLDYPQEGALIKLPRSWSWSLTS